MVSHCSKVCCACCCALDLLVQINMRCYGDKPPSFTAKVRKDWLVGWPACHGWNLSKCTQPCNLCCKGAIGIAQPAAIMLLTHTCGVSPLDCLRPPAWQAQCTCSIRRQHNTTNAGGPTATSMPHWLPFECAFQPARDHSDTQPSPADYHQPALHTMGVSSHTSLCRAQTHRCRLACCLSWKWMAGL